MHRALTFALHAGLTGALALGCALAAGALAVLALLLAMRAYVGPPPGEGTAPRGAARTPVGIRVGPGDGPAFVPDPAATVAVPPAESRQRVPGAQGVGQRAEAQQERRDLAT